jgi:phosphopantothenoylcysteine synthetase/decarboxylase
MTTRHLLVVTCGAEPAADVGILLALASRSGWSAAVVATPNALPFLDAAAIETLTGSPPRSDFEAPSPHQQRRATRKADAVIIAPATYNTINKLAAGIADTYALTITAELIGLAVPMVIVPFVNTALAARTPYQNAIRTLHAEGIHVFGTDNQWKPHEPGTGSTRQQQFPWRQAFDLATALAGREVPPGS